MSNSTDYRKRTIEYREEGHMLEETHEIFKVAISTISLALTVEQRNDVQKAEAEIQTELFERTVTALSMWSNTNAILIWSLYRMKR